MEQVDESFRSLRTKSRENTYRGKSLEGPNYRSNYAKQLVETLQNMDGKKAINRSPLRNRSKSSEKRV